jgi:hypothetical protein
MRISVKHDQVVTLEERFWRLAGPLWHILSANRDCKKTLICISGWKTRIEDPEHSAARPFPLAADVNLNLR